MTTGELICSAQLRAELSQEQLAERLGVPRSSIARWETGSVEPDLSTLRRLLQACGFDLSLALEPHVRGRELKAWMQLERLTPQRRLRDMLDRAREASSAGRFDPYAIVRELERAPVYAVLVGALARVIQGSDELTRGLDLTPALHPPNLEKLEQALENLNARRSDGRPPRLITLDPEREPIITLESDAGEIKIVPQPSGTRGFKELHRRSGRHSLGDGLHPEVAGASDLVRMLEARGAGDAITIETMRRADEVEQRLDLGL